MRFLLTFALAAFSVAASGYEISIDKPIINFDNNTNDHKMVIVSNHSDQKAYVKVTPYKINVKNGSNPEYVKIDNPEKYGLIVSPQSLVLQAKGEQKVSIYNINSELSSDAVYRVRFEPVISGFKKQKDALSIKVLIGYESLILVQPDEPKPKYEASLDGGVLTFKNKGNTNILLSKITSCDPQKVSKKDCDSAKSKRVYAGETFTVQNLMAEQYFLLLKIGKEYTLEKVVNESKG